MLSQVEIESIKQKVSITALYANLTSFSVRSGSRGNIAACFECGKDNHCYLYDNFTSAKPGLSVCYSCGAKNDVVGLTAKIKNISQGQAIYWLRDVFLGQKQEIAQESAMAAIEGNEEKELLELLDSYLAINPKFLEVLKAWISTK